MVFKYWVVAGRFKAAVEPLFSACVLAFSALSEALLGRTGACSIVRCSLLSRLLFIAHPKACPKLSLLLVLLRLEAICT